MKKRKYAQLASQRQHELLPFVAETCGGLAPSAVKLMQAMAQAAAVHLRPVVEDCHSSGTSGISRHRRAARKRHGVPRGIRQQPACDEQRECGSDGRWGGRWERGGGGRGWGRSSESESSMCGGVGRSREKWYVRDVMCLLRSACARLLYVQWFVWLTRVSIQKAIILSGSLCVRLRKWGQPAWRHA